MVIQQNTLSSPLASPAASLPPPANQNQSVEQQGLNGNKQQVSNFMNALNQTGQGRSNQFMNSPQQMQPQMQPVMGQSPAPQVLNTPNQVSQNTLTAPMAGGQQLSQAPFNMLGTNTPGYYGGAPQATPSVDNTGTVANPPGSVDNTGTVANPPGSVDNTGTVANPPGSIYNYGTGGGIGSSSQQTQGTIGVTPPPLPTNYVAPPTYVPPPALPSNFVTPNPFVPPPEPGTIGSGVGGSNDQGTTTSGNGIGASGNLYNPTNPLPNLIQSDVGLNTAPTPLPTNYVAPPTYVPPPALPPNYVAPPTITPTTTTPLQNTGGTISQNSGSGLGLLYSDENLKEHITPGDRDLNQFLNTIKAHNYEYKNPAQDGVGRFTSPMAQELEKTELGKQAVIETPRGKMVDYARLGGVNLAAVSVVHRETQKLQQQVNQLRRMFRGTK